MKKTWKILDESIYDSYDENNDPQKILNYYGRKLKSDTRNLLGYCITGVDEYDQNNEIIFGGKKTYKFDVKININSNYLPFFEVSYKNYTGYPCVFQNKLKDDEPVICNNSTELKFILEKVISSENTIVTISKIMYKHYSKEIINKINNNLK